MKIRKVDWKNDIETIAQLINDGYSVEDISFLYSVNRSLVYKMLIKFGVETGKKIKPNFLRGKSKEVKWLHRNLLNKKLTKEGRMLIIENLHLPEICPILGIKLNYENSFYKKDDSPSIDRIDSNRGYELENLHIISERANRIKNDSIPEELIKIANYIISIAK